MVMTSARVIRLIQVLPSAGAAPRPMDEIAIFSQNVVDGSQNGRVVGCGRKPGSVAAAVGSAGTIPAHQSVIGLIAAHLIESRNTSNESMMDRLEWPTYVTGFPQTGKAE